MDDQSMAIHALDRFRRSGKAPRALRAMDRERHARISRGPVVGPAGMVGRIAVSGPVSLEMSAKGQPEARVPRDLGWQLIEYLSYQRVSVTYRFEADQVVVCFHNLDQPAVQSLLDGWLSGRQRYASGLDS